MSKKVDKSVDHTESRPKNREEPVPGTGKEVKKSKQKGSRNNP